MNRTHSDKAFQILSAASSDAPFITDSTESAALSTVPVLAVPEKRKTILMHGDVPNDSNIIYIKNRPEV